MSHSLKSDFITDLPRPTALLQARSGSGIWYAEKEVRPHEVSREINGACPEGARSGRQNQFYLTCLNTGAVVVPNQQGFVVDKKHMHENAYYGAGSIKDFERAVRGRNHIFLTLSPEFAKASNFESDVSIFNHIQWAEQYVVVPIHSREELSLQSEKIKAIVGGAANDIVSLSFGGAVLPIAEAREQWGVNNAKAKAQVVPIVSVRQSSDTPQATTLQDQESAVSPPTRQLALI